MTGVQTCALPIFDAPQPDAEQNLWQNFAKSFSKVESFNEAQNSGVSLNESSASIRNSGVNIDFDEMPSFGESSEQDGEEIDGESKFSAGHDLAEAQHAAQNAPQKQEFQGQNLDDVIAGGVAPQTEGAHKNLAGTPRGVKDTSQIGRAHV